MKDGCVRGDEKAKRGEGAEKKRGDRMNLKNQRGAHP